MTGMAERFGSLFMDAHMIAVHYGHHYIAHNEAGIVPTSQFQTFLSIVSNNYCVTVLFKQTLKPLGLHSAVFDDQNLVGGLHRLTWLPFRKS